MYLNVRCDQDISDLELFSKCNIIEGVLSLNDARRQKYIIESSIQCFVSDCL